MPSLHSETQEKTSSSSIVSDRRPPIHRVFKLDSPFINDSALGVKTNNNNDRFRLTSDVSDLSVPYSLEHCSFVEKTGQMTDSLLNFLEKQDYKHEVPQTVSSMTESLISVAGRSESPTDGCAMTDSLINFLDPVSCRPPSGFRDNDMTDSVVNIDEVAGFANCEMTTSIQDYLQNVKSNSPDHLIKSIASSETENIPPTNCVSDHEYQDRTDVTTEKSDGTLKESNKMNSTYTLEKEIYELAKSGNTCDDDRNNEMDEINNISITNTVNTTRKINEKSNNDEMNRTNKLNTTYEINVGAVQDKIAKCVKVSALNSRDLNLNTKNETSKQIPSRNSILNTSYTKLPSLQGIVNITKVNCGEFARSTETLHCGLEDDTTSSASDSSFSSDSTKPRSMGELRTIAQQQECSKFICVRHLALGTCVD